MVESVCRRRSKEIGMGVSIYIRKNKYGEGSRLKIQQISEKNTGQERNGYTSVIQDRVR